MYSWIICLLGCSLQYFVLNHLTSDGTICRCIVFAFAGSLKIISIFMFMYCGSSERSSRRRTLVIIRRPVRRQLMLSSSWPSTWPPRLRLPSKHRILGLLTHCFCHRLPRPSAHFLSLCPMYFAWNSTESLTVLQTYCALSLLFAYAVPSTWNALPPPRLGKCQLFLQGAVQRSLSVKVTAGGSASRLLGRGTHPVPSALKVLWSCFSMVLITENCALFA